jgi:hypothetical protein
MSDLLCHSDMWKTCIMTPIRMIPGDDLTYRNGFRFNLLAWTAGSVTSCRLVSQWLRLLFASWYAAKVLELESGGTLT